MSSFTALIVATLAVFATQSSPAACFGTNLSAGPGPSPAAPKPKGPAAVSLGTAGNFAILTKSGVTNVPTSTVTGDIGASPITGGAIHVSCTEVEGNIYTVDAEGPACRMPNASMLTTAISNMETAYTDAAGRADPDFVNLGSGVLISNDVVLTGNSEDTYIFQIAGDLVQATDTRVLMAEGSTLQAKNIFWQVAGYVSINTNSHFEGITLCATKIDLKTGASVNGRLLSQTAVTLQMNTVTEA